MQTSNPDNANPTILNKSQLPSRARTNGSEAKAPESKHDDILSGKSSVLFWGFLDEFAWPSDSEGVAEDSDASSVADPIDEQEIYDLISTISDPEHPHTLGQLSVINLPDIHISNPAGTMPRVLVEITPTITHCSLATVIGLAVRVRLEQALPPNFRVDVRMKAGSHSQDDQVNKQLGDKERVAAALENETLGSMLDQMLETCK